jgi:hypothetical protein
MEFIEITTFRIKLINNILQLKTNNNEPKRKYGPFQAAQSTDCLDISQSSEDWENENDSNSNEYPTQGKTASVINSRIERTDQLKFNTETSKSSLIKEVKTKKAPESFFF